MGLSNKFSCEPGSFSCCCNPHRFLLPEVLRPYFPELKPWVAWSVHYPVVPPGLSTCKCGTACSASCHLTWPASYHLRASPLYPQLPISAPPPCLDECFFFNSLVVGLPYSLIFLAVLVIFCFSICHCPSFGFVRRQSVSTYAPSWLEVGCLISKLSSLKYNIYRVKLTFQRCLVLSVKEICTFI